MILNWEILLRISYYNWVNFFRFGWLLYLRLLFNLTWLIYIIIINRCNNFWCRFKLAAWNLVLLIGRYDLWLRCLLLSWLCVWISVKGNYVVCFWRYDNLDAFLLILLVRLYVIDLARWLISYGIIWFFCFAYFTKLF